MNKYLLLVLLCLVQVGCLSTVVPKPVHSEQASFDGVERTSGVVQFSSELGGFIVTDNFVRRYDALVDIYGNTKDSLTRLPYFAPALVRRYGVSQTRGMWIITPDAMTKFVRMNQWRKAGRVPLS